MGQVYGQIETAAVQVVLNGNTPMGIRARVVVRRVLWNSLPLLRRGFSLVGLPWTRFYSWLIDYQERRTTIDGIIRQRRQQTGRDKGLYDLSRGEYHARFLIDHGLRTDHIVLDYGCGFGRTAVPLIRYLQPGKFIGVEISRRRLSIAQDYVAREGVTEKLPRMLLSHDLDMGYLTNGEVDMMWAQSVFTHMPRGDVERVLAALNRVLSPRGTAVFNYAVSEDGHVRHNNVKDYQYPRDTMRKMIEAAGFAHTELRDWQSDLPLEERSHRNEMLMIARDETVLDVLGTASGV